jgi:hypothetical protein
MNNPTKGGDFFVLLLKAPKEIETFFRKTVISSLLRLML